jgi:DNA-binding transcriptional regulator GbsR (MarR family)
MSYSEHYSETISGTEYVEVYHPASETSSSETVSVHWSEDVNIVITVDTSSFDNSVSTIKHHIDGLAGAVIATEAGQIEEKARGAQAISQAETDGFFRLIGSEITQQMAALKSRVDSLFLKLNDMRIACQRIQQNMKRDYHRITDRYSSIFEELDREMATRIARLDEAAYALNRQVSSEDRRGFDSTLSTVPTVFAAENSRAQTVLSAGTLRSRMNELLQCAVAYLASEKRTSNAMSTMLVTGGQDNSATMSLPVAYLASSDMRAEAIVLPPAPGPLTDDPDMNRRILAQFRERNLSWRPLADDHRAQIERFLFPLVDAIHTPSQGQDARVRQIVLRLWNAHTPEVLPL